MRIAFFTDTYKPQVNGVVTSVTLFAKELRKRNKVYIFSPSGTGEKNCYPSPSVPFPAYSGYRVGLPYNIVAPDMDIVHVHSPFTMGMAGMALAKRRNIPIVGTFHTMFPDYLHYLMPDFLIRSALHGAAKRMSWAFLRAFYNRCDAVIAPSKTVARALAKHGIKNVRVIPTGMDFAKHDYTNGMKRRLGITGKMVLHVGRVTKEKRIDFLMDALSCVDATLVVASDGPLRKELERKAGKNVIFTGYLSEKELRGLYREADAFVMASRSETQGLVLLEAASHGVPCVVLDAPVISDFVKENRIGTVATEKGFAAAVKKTLEKGMRIDVRGPKRKYDIRKCAAELENLY
ncbi:MAG: glycosyltransferase, partial [Candidatus Aenigmarchaeota archaeon]|nr:glycosyltransferase [Candidatus Aenigmarchaeota archaeon]